MLWLQIHLFQIKNKHNKEHKNIVNIWDDKEYTKDTLREFRKKLPNSDNLAPISSKIDKLVEERNLDALFQNIKNFARTVVLKELRLPNNAWMETILVRIYDLTLLDDICNYMVVDKPEHEYYLCPFKWNNILRSGEFESYCNFFDSYFLEIQKRLDSQKTSAINKHMVGTYLNRG